MSSGSSVVSQSIMASATSTADEAAPEAARRLRAEAPADRREEGARQEFDQRIAQPIGLPQAEHRPRSSR